MLKSFIVNNIKELGQLEKKLYESMDETLSQISSEIGLNSSQTLFSKMKFGGIGFDPLDSKRKLNIVEQINLLRIFHHFTHWKFYLLNTPN